MSAGEQKQAAAARAADAPAGESLLEAAISATKQTERSRAQDLLRALTEEALKGNRDVRQRCDPIPEDGYRGH